MATPVSASGDGGGPGVVVEDGGVLYPDASITIPDGAATDAAPVQR